MNIEKEIYKALISNANGVVKDVKDVTPPTLRELKKGTGKTSIFKVFDLLFNNGIKEIKLTMEHSELTLDSEKRELISKPFLTNKKKVTN